MKGLVKLIILILALSTIFVLSACGTSSDDALDETPSNNLKPDDEGAKSYSEKLDFDLSEDGAYYIVSEIGECTDTEIKIPPTFKNKPVKSIADGAFYACRKIVSITIPDSVTSIGEGEFDGCTKLVNVTIADSVTDIGPSAFRDCKALVDITIPDSVKNIGSSAFCGCTSLAIITISDNVTSIGSFAFKNTAYYNYIGNWRNDALFIGNHLIEVKDTITGSYAIKDGTKCLADRVFYNCDSLTSIKIPNSVTSIGKYAFYACNSLASVTIGDNVTSIGSSAFEYCDSLTSVRVGGNVTSIGVDAFGSCYRLIEVINKSSLKIVKGSEKYGYVAYNALYVHNGESKIVNVNDYLFVTDDKANNYLVNYIGNDTELTLPKNYNGKNYSIYHWAFFDNDKITTVVIPDSITMIGDVAFQECTAVANCNGAYDFEIQVSVTTEFETKNYIFQCLFNRDGAAFTATSMNLSESNIVL